MKLGDRYFGLPCRRLFYLHAGEQYHCPYPYWADWEPNYLIVYDPQENQQLQELLIPPSFPGTTQIHLIQPIK